VHTGKLPENRGAYPVFWKIIENEDVFSVSIHRVEEKIDAGEVLLIREGDFSNLVFSHDFFTAFYNLAAEALIQVIEKISTSSLHALPIDETKSHYYPKYTEADFALNPEEDINLLHKKINRLQFYGNPTILNYALIESSILYNHPIDIQQHILIVISKNSVVLKNSSGILLIKHLT
jgi:methionyl-tRNA formyltransferase